MVSVDSLGEGSVAVVAGAVDVYAWSVEAILHPQDVTLLGGQVERRLTVLVLLIHIDVSTFCLFR